MPSPAAPRWLLCVVCFASGALTLVIEIAGNRLLAPLFGNSVYTWTALIGVVLVAISVGGCLGGLLVDRAPRLGLLGYLLLVAAAWTLLIPWFHSLLGDLATDAGLVSGPLLAAVALFSVPACLLAAVSPFVIRLLSRSTGDHAIGLSAGLVGMLSTLGSFVGTFLTGFYLLPLVGVRTVFLASGLIAAALGGLVLTWGRGWRPLPATVAVIAVAAAAGMSWRLAPDGVLMANLISPITGDQAAVFQAILATIRTQFSVTQVYAVDPQAPDRPGNVLVVAANRRLDLDAVPDDPLLRHLFSTRVAAEAYEPVRGPVLTDDRNPIDALVARQLRATD